MRSSKKSYKEYTFAEISESISSKEACERIRINLEYSKKAFASDLAKHAGNYYSLLRQYLKLLEEREIEKRLNEKIKKERTERTESESEKKERTESESESDFKGTDSLSESSFEFIDPEIPLVEDILSASIISSNADASIKSKTSNRAIVITGEVQKEINDLRDILEKKFRFGMLLRFNGLTWPQEDITTVRNYKTIAKAVNEKYGCKKVNRKFEPNNFSAQILTLAISINSRVKNSDLLNPFYLEATIQEIIDIVIRLKAFANQAENEFNKTEFIEYKKIQNNCEAHIKAYKNLLNDLMMLAKETHDKSEISQSTRKTTEDAFCTGMDNAFYSHMFSMLRAPFATGYQDPTRNKFVKESLKRLLTNNSNAEKQALLISYNDQFNILSSSNSELMKLTTEGKKRLILESIEFFDKIIALLKDSTDKDFIILKKYYEDCRVEFLNEWAIYFTPNVSDQGEFGYLNPYFHFNHEIPSEFQQINELLAPKMQTVIDNNFNQVLAENLSELKSNRDKLTAPPFKKNPQLGNQANSPDRISDVLDGIETELNKTRKGVNQQSYISLLKNYADKWSENTNGISKDSKDTAKFLSAQTTNVNQVINKNKNLLTFIEHHQSRKNWSSSSSSTSSNQNLAKSKDELFSHMLLEKNKNSYENTKTNLNWFGIKILKAVLGTPASENEVTAHLNYLEYKNLTQSENNPHIAQYKQKNMINWNKDDYLNYLEETSHLIIKLRMSQFYVSSVQARYFEDLCYEMIDNLTNNQTKTNFDFSIEQLQRLKNVVLEIRERGVIFDMKGRDDTNTKLLIQLNNKMHQLRKISANRLYLNEAAIDASANKQGYRKKQGLVENSSLIFKVFSENFVEKMHSMAIGNAAVSSGLVAIKTTTKATAIGTVGDLALGKLLLPQIAGTIATTIDHGITKSNATTTNIATGDLTSWLPLIKKLAPQVLNLFKPALATMTNADDAIMFATLCQKRMYSALLDKPDWWNTLTLKLEQLKQAEIQEIKNKGMYLSNEKLIQINEELDEKILMRLLIAAIFKQTDSVGITPRDDHYYTARDGANVLAKQTLQKLIAYAGFAILEDNNAEIYIPKNSLQGSRKIPKNLNKARLEKYGLLDGSDDPEFYRILAADINRQGFDYVKKDIHNDKGLSSSMFTASSITQMTTSSTQTMTTSSIPKINAPTKSISTSDFSLLAKLDPSKTVAKVIGEQVIEIHRNRHAVKC